MKKFAVAILFGAFVAAPAVAKDMYVGFKLGTTKNEIQEVKENSSAYGIYGGYKVSQNIAVEAGYNDLGSMGSGALKISAVELRGVGLIPISEPFSLYIKLGVSKSAAKISGQTIDRSVGSIGLGGLYNATPTIGVAFGMDVYGFGKANTIVSEGASIMLSASALYRF